MSEIGDDSLDGVPLLRDPPLPFRWFSFVDMISPSKSRPSLPHFRQRRQLRPENTKDCCQWKSRRKEA